jgi:hypothetical protein
VVSDSGTTVDPFGGTSCLKKLLRFLPFWTMRRRTKDSTRDWGKRLHVSAQDGLRLHVREYDARAAPGLPVVCLPGLARTT